MNFCVNVFVTHLSTRLSTHLLLRVHPLKHGHSCFEQYAVA